MYFLRFTCVVYCVQTIIVLDQITDIEFLQSDQTSNMENYAVLLKIWGKIKKSFNLHLLLKEGYFQNTTLENLVHLKSFTHCIRIVSWTALLKSEFQTLPCIHSDPLALGTKFKNNAEFYYSGSSLFLFLKTTLACCVSYVTVTQKSIYSLVNKAL